MLRFIAFWYINSVCLSCQAHDIIVVELAPPPARETDGDEADPAVDAEAAAAVALPKVAEKKKVYLGSALTGLRPSAMSLIASGARLAQHPTHQKGA